MLFGNSWLLSKRNAGLEGFVSFGYNNTNLMQVTISPYSSKNQVIYLYDNLYFDGKNANIVEVDSPYCGNVRVNGSTVGGNINCEDSTGSSITQIWVTPSTSNTVNFNINSNNTAGLNNVINITPSPQISQLTYLSNSQNLSTSSTSGYRYQMFYITWGLDTYLHLLGLDSNKSAGQNIKSFNYNNAGNMMRYIDFNSSTYIPNYNQSFNSNADANNSKFYIDTLYNPNFQIYQITAYVKYDILNGNIIIGNATNKSYTIYNRVTGTTVSAPTNLVNDSSTNTVSSRIDTITNFVSWIVSDGNNGMVLVLAFGKQTIISVINADPNNKYYNLNYCARFSDTAFVTSVNDANNIHINSIQNGVKPGPVGPAGPDMPCTDELSCKWYYYFKTIGNDPSVLFKNDFIRKTQIVPPVCPRCPNCPDLSGVCTSCGGSGGSGTYDSSGSLIRDAAKGTVNLAKDAVTGTVGLAKETVGGAVDLTKEAVGGTVGLVKGAVRGTVGLASGIAGGIQGQGNVQGQQSDSGFGYVPGQGYTPVDNYSAYGAMQSKGSNFMPVTASFSAFGK